MGQSWNLAQGDEIVPGRLALEHIGGGDLFETWLAWDSELFSVVVAKLVRPDLVSDDGAIATLVHEAELLDRLTHPVIVRRFGSVLEGARPHLVLEHLEGVHLRSVVLRHGAQSLESVLPLALHLCSALHYLHGRHVVHLDVKARNIVMGPVPRLIDFSIAASIEDAAMLTEPVGTPAYMAPEQCEPGRRGTPGPAADVWGLGVTLFESIAGARPFPDGDMDSDDPIARYPQLTMERQAFGRDVPGALDDIVGACLAPTPADRPRPSDVALALEPLVAQLPRPHLVRRRRGWR